MSKKVMKSVFAMLPVLGAGTLIACSSQTRPSGPTIVENSNHDNSGSQTSNNSGSENANNSSSENTNNSGSENNNSSQQNQEELERQIGEQLISFEDAIETKLKDTLNNRFQENIVENVDIRTFTVGTNQTANTTLLANGYVNFVGDETPYLANLGMSLDEDAFLSLTPISYVEASMGNNLADNYNLDQLQTVHDFITGENLTFNYARLDGAKWDLDCFTGTQIEHSFEQYFETKMRDFFAEEVNTPYIHNLDLKYFTVETADHNLRGNVIHAHGTAQSIKTEREYTTKITIRPSAEVFQNLYSTLSNAQYDETKDLAQNYQIADLNSVVNCFKDDSTTILEYSVNGHDYIVTSDRIW